MQENFAFFAFVRYSCVGGGAMSSPCKNIPADCFYNW